MARTPAFLVGLSALVDGIGKGLEIRRANTIENRKQDILEQEAEIRAAKEEREKSEAVLDAEVKELTKTKTRQPITQREEAFPLQQEERRARTAKAFAEAASAPQAKVDTRITKLESTLTAQNTSILKFQKELEENGKELIDIEKSLSSMNPESKRFKQKSAEAELLREAIESKSTAVDAIQKRIDDTTGELDALRAQKESPEVVLEEPKTLQAPKQEVRLTSRQQGIFSKIDAAQSEEELIQIFDEAESLFLSPAEIDALKEKGREALIRARRPIPEGAPAEVPTLPGESVSGPFELQ